MCGTNSEEKMVPMGLRMPRNAAAMPLKPMAGRVVVFRGFHSRAAGQIEQAGAETGQCAGNGHGKDDVLLLVDAGVAGGVLVAAAPP